MWLGIDVVNCPPVFFLFLTLAFIMKHKYNDQNGKQVGIVWQLTRIDERGQTSLKRNPLLLRWLSKLILMLSHVVVESPIRG